MARSEFKAIMTTKPVVSKVEAFKAAKGLPSNSQALAMMVEEAGKHDALLSLIQTMLAQMEKLIQKAQAEGKDAVGLVMNFAEILAAFLQQAKIQLTFIE